MKILNLYAGVGGNRRLWTGHDVTAVENHSPTAAAYAALFPDDKIMVCDAHLYLLNHYKEFDFIWSSPPCLTHTQLRFGFCVVARGDKYEYPDLGLYQEIILLSSLYKGLWCVENVIPYYKYLIPPTVVIGRHAYWANFPIPPKTLIGNNNIYKPKHGEESETKYHEKRLGFTLDGVTGIKKRVALHNCVEPCVGLYILNHALKKENADVFST